MNPGKNVSSNQNNTANQRMIVPLLPTAMSGVDVGDRSNDVAQSVNGNVLITYRQRNCRGNIFTQL